MGDDMHLRLGLRAGARVWPFSRALSRIGGGR